MTDTIPMKKAKHIAATTLLLLSFAAGNGAQTVNQAADLGTTTTQEQQA